MTRQTVGLLDPAEAYVRDVSGGGGDVRDVGGGGGGEA